MVSVRVHQALRLVKCKEYNKRKKNEKVRLTAARLAQKRRDPLGLKATPMPPRSKKGGRPAVHLIIREMIMGFLDLGVKATAVKGALGTMLRQQGLEDKVGQYLRK